MGENAAWVWQRCVVATDMNRRLSEKEMQYLLPGCVGKSVTLQDAGMKRGFPGWVRTCSGKAGGSSQRGQYLGSDTVPCVCINDHRMKNRCVLMAFCRCLKLRCMASVAGHDVIFQEKPRAWRTGVTEEVTLNWTKCKPLAGCTCRLIKTSANKLGICYLVHPYVSHGMLMYCSSPRFKKKKRL